MRRAKAARIDSDSGATLSDNNIEAVYHGEPTRSAASVTVTF